MGMGERPSDLPTKEAALAKHARSWSVIKTLAETVIDKNVIATLESNSDYVPVVWSASRLFTGNKTTGNYHWIHGQPQERVISALFWSKQRRLVEGLVHFGRLTEGHHNCVHGGALASLLDDVEGMMCVLRTGCNTATKTLEMSYKKFVPIGVPVWLRGEVVEVEGRMVSISMSLFAFENGKPGAELCTAKGQFVALRALPASILYLNDLLFSNPSEGLEVVPKEGPPPVRSRL